MGDTTTGWAGGAVGVGGAVVDAGGAAAWGGSVAGVAGTADGGAAARVARAVACRARALESDGGTGRDAASSAPTLPTATAERTQRAYFIPPRPL
jgi:hypothetical protein